MRTSFCSILFLTVILYFFVNQELSAQTTFQYTIGGKGNEQAQDLIALPDGGFAITGFTSSYGSGSEDIYLIKLNNSFGLEWSKVHGSQNNDRGHKLIESQTGGFLITGRTNTNGNNNPWDMMLAKTDDSGELNWIRSNGGNQNEVGWGLVELADNNLIFSGTSRSYGVTGNGAYLFKTNPLGSPEWGYIFDNTSPMGAPASDYFRDIILCSTGNYVYMTGTVKRPGTCPLDVNRSNWYMLIAKADLNGQLIWHTYVGGNACREIGYNLIQTDDGNIVATGFTQNYGAGGDDVYLVKVDANTGNLIWTRTFGGPGDERANQVKETADGGLILTGWTDSYGAGSRDLFLLKTDQEGNIEWSRTYGGPGEEEGHAVLQTDDLGFFIAGYTSSHGNGEEDILLIKTDEEGRLQHCDYESPNPIQGTGGITHSGLRISQGYSVNPISAETEIPVDSITPVLCCPIAEFEVFPACIEDTVEIINLSQGEISSWHWNFGDGSESNDQFPTHLYTEPGTYLITLIVSDITGCSDTVSAPVKVVGHAVAQIHGDSTLCAGMTTELTAKPDGAQYLWSTGSVEQKISVSVDKNTDFYVVVSDSLNCTIDTAFINIEVKTLPAPVLEGPTVICAGESIEITATPEEYQYFWSTGGMGPSISFSSNKDTMVFAIGADSMGCESDTAKIFINVLPEGFYGMSNARDTVLGSLDEDCERAFIIFDADLDFCGTILDMQDYARWEIDLHNNGTVDFTSLENRPDGSKRSNLRLEEYLPFGTHQLIWTFESPGGMIETEKHLITVVDNKPPTPVCLHGITSTVMPATGMISLPAKIWDLSSWDNCTPKGNLTFSFSSNPSHTFHTWTCEDLNGNKELHIPIEIWVTDESGHQDYCKTYFLLKDNQDSCPSMDSITHNISGMVLSPLAVPIDEVLITAETESGDKLSFFNGEDGTFFHELIANQSYEISGLRSQPTNDPFSILDILAIQKHILGIKPFTNPYTFIAADVNGDGKINILDVQLLRDGLLGNLEPARKFEKWKIFPKQNFNTTEGEVPAYTNSYVLNPIAGHVEDIYFIAVQTGKVHQLTKVESSNRTLAHQQKIALNISNRSFKPGQTFKIPLRMDNLDSKAIHGFEASFYFNPDILIFEDFSSAFIPIGEHHLGLTLLNEGLLSINWSNPFGTPIPKDQPFLELEFTAKIPGFLSDHFEMRKTPIAGNIYTAESRYNLELLYSDSYHLNESLRVGSNLPNPFKQKTQIPIRLDHDENLIIEIFDLSGRMVSESTAFFKKGTHTLDIDGSIFPAAGIYIYSIQTDEAKKTGKLMVSD